VQQNLESRRLNPLRSAGETFMQTPPSSFHIFGGGHPSSDTGSSTQAIEEELKRSLKNT
jgi:hypothetical protein